MSARANIYRETHEEIRERRRRRGKAKRWGKRTNKSLDLPIAPEFWWSMAILFISPCWKEKIIPIPREWIR